MHVLDFTIKHRGRGECRVGHRHCYSTRWLFMDVDEQCRVAVLLRYQQRQWKRQRWLFNQREHLDIVANRHADDRGSDVYGRPGRYVVHLLDFADESHAALGRWRIEHRHRDGAHWLSMVVDEQCRVDHVPWHDERLREWQRRLCRRRQQLDDRTQRHDDDRRTDIHCRSGRGDVRQLLVVPNQHFSRRQHDDW